MRERTLEKIRAMGYRQIGLAATSIVFITLLFLAFSELKVAVAIFLGGTIWLVPNLYFAHQLFSRFGKAAPQLLIKIFYVTECIKLALSAVFFVLVVQWVNVPVIPLFLGYLLTQCVFLLTPWMTELRQ